jgi:hypothetical protein
MEPGKTLLNRACALIAAHPAVRLGENILGAAEKE